VQVYTLLKPHRQHGDIVKHVKAAADIRVGVIGYGGRCLMGKIHLTDMRKAGMTPAAICDTGAAQRNKAREDWPGVAVYADVATLLRKSDANLIVIITPHKTHYRLAMQCLKAGRHVVLEKPFAIRLAECDRMIAAARKRGLMLTTYHNRHWDGCVLGALRHIRKGQIGALVRVNVDARAPGLPDARWRWSKSISGGLLYDWGVHYLEYALQLIDSDLVEVAGFAARGTLAVRSPWKDDTNEDEASIVARFANGVVLNLTMTGLDPTPPDPNAPIFRLQGTRGHYAFNLLRWELKRARPGGRLLVESGPSPATRWDLFYRNIAAHLVDGEALVITPEWARRPIQILDLADQSARRGKALQARYA
jgi:scyllo-inositol 2-dehydrogenase (NADP+)